MFEYYWSKLIKKLPGSSKLNVKLEKTAKIEARSTAINVAMGRYSYCGYACKILNCNIGNFTSIADHVVIGVGKHPMEWVSTSPAFYKGRDSIPKNLACLEYNSSPKLTVIGNDVWIGEGVYIKDGVKVGNGAVIGMNSVVTKDIPPYAIVAGVPATVIRYRFDEITIEKLLDSKWWELTTSELRKYAPYMNDVSVFLEKMEEQRNR